MLADFPIKPALVRDAEQILKLQYLCYQAEAAIYDDYRISPLTQSLASLLSDYDTQLLLTALFEEEVVGSVRGRFADGTCHIGRLMVHPRLQGRGIGGRLMRAVEEHFATADRYEFFTGHQSEKNLRLYRHLGYSPFREEDISPRLRLIYLEKYRT